MGLDELKHIKYKLFNTFVEFYRSSGNRLKKEKYKTIVK